MRVAEEADDGVLHDLWHLRVDPARVEGVLAILRLLVIHRGNFNDTDRADAAGLANDLDWPLGHLPIVQEALAS